MCVYSMDKIEEEVRSVYVYTQRIRFKKLDLYMCILYGQGERKKIR